MRTALLALTLAAMPVLAAAQASPQAAYGKKVSQGVVTLEFEPEWLDTALVVMVRLKTKDGDLGKMGIHLRDQMMLTADRQTYAPTASGGTLGGRQSLVWVAFKVSKKPTTFALSVRDVPDVPMRIVKWSEAVLTPE
jgi:hypothetical protein